MTSYTIFDNRPYIISGWGDRTDWYRNILANPAVTVQVGGNTFSAQARRVTDKEEFAGVMRHMVATGGDTHFESWLQSLDIGLDPEDMIAKRDRVYMITFEPSEVYAPPPLPTDLKWVSGVIAFIPLLVWLKKRMRQQIL